MEITRQALMRMTKSELFDWYITHVGDEMSPLMWNGASKAYWVDSIMSMGKGGLGYTPGSIRPRPTVGKIEFKSLMEY